MEITWLGVAGFCLRARAAAVWIDPFLSSVCSRLAKRKPPLEELPPPAAILLSHGHFDHAYDALDLATRFRAPILAPPALCRQLHRRAAPGVRLLAIPYGQGLAIADIFVRLLPSRHVHMDAALILPTVLRIIPHLTRLCLLARRFPLGGIGAWLLEADGVKLLHFGSAGWQAEALLPIRPDMALIPLQGHSQIMSIALKMVDILKPRFVIPHHWDDFCPPLSRQIDPQPFAKMVSDRFPPVRVFIPEPFRPISLP